MDDIEMREGLGSLGCEKEILVVVVMSEEEPLRSDTRLPLESSPYMAGNFLHCKKAARAVNLLQTVASDINSLCFPTSGTLEFFNL